MKELCSIDLYLIGKYKTLKQQFASSRFIRDVFTLSCGTALSQLIAVLALPIISRIYSPGVFGGFAVFMAVSTVLSNITGGKYELAIILPKSQRSAINLMALTFLLNIFFCGVGAILLLALYVLFPQIFDYFKLDHILLFSYPSIMLLLAINNTFQYMANRQGKYRVSAMSQISRILIMVFVQISLGYYYPKLSSLVFGYVVSCFVGVFIFYFGVFRQLCFWSKISLCRIKILAKRYSKFPRYSLFSDLLNTGSVQFPVILISAFFSAAVAGYFSMSYRVLAAPIALIGAAFAQVFYQKAATLKDRSNELQNFVQKGYLVLSISAIVPMTILMVYGSELFTYVFGAKWTMAGVFSQYMAIWLIFVFIGSPISTLYFVKERQGLAMVMNVLMFSSRIFVVLICYYLSLQSVDLIVVFSITGAILWFFNNLIILHLANVRWRYSIGAFSLIFGLVFLAQIGLKKVIF